MQFFISNAAQAISLRRTAESYVNAADRGIHGRRLCRTGWKESCRRRDRKCSPRTTTPSSWCSATPPSSWAPRWPRRWASSTLLSCRWAPPWWASAWCFVCSPSCWGCYSSALHRLSARWGGSKSASRSSWLSESCFIRQRSRMWDVRLLTPILISEETAGRFSKLMPNVDPLRGTMRGQPVKTKFQSTTLAAKFSTVLSRLAIDFVNRLLDFSGRCTSRYCIRSTYCWLGWHAPKQTTFFRRSNPPAVVKVLRPKVWID